MDNRRANSLTLRFLAALVLSAAAGVGLFFLCRFAGTQLVSRFYLSDRQISTRIEGDIASLRAYVEENMVSSTDAAAIGAWNRAHPDVRLIVSAGDTILSSDRFGAELMLSDSGLSLLLGPENKVDFPVNFSDGACSVSISNHAEARLYRTVSTFSLISGILLFLVSMLIESRRVTLSLLRVSRQVRAVSQGDLQRAITSPSRDEIGQLARDVDAMRLSILDKLRREEDAWQANSQLITAISHDVRTPLTALMGYLDLLSDPQLDPRLTRSYLNICRSNALRLKDLTDELFGFFLVFGQRTPQVHPEPFDAYTLLEQILVEAAEDLRQQNFQVRLNLSDSLSGTISVDLGGLRRIFENLFSNLKKYADPAAPISVTGTAADGRVTLTMENAIFPAPRAESNGIGLKTCRKLAEAMGGRFDAAARDGVYTAVLTLPLTPAV